MKKYLLIGATGLVGHGITRHLLSSGNIVYGTSRRKLISNHPNFHPIRLDLNKKESFKNLEPIINTCDCLIFNAAQTRTPGATKDDFYNVNVHSIQQILNLCTQKLKFILISGTALVNFKYNINSHDYPFLPKDDYITSKIISELLVRQFSIEKGLESCILRISAPYGYCPTQMAVIPKFIENVRNGKDIILLGTGAREQAFTFTEDVGVACRLVTERSASGTYNICGSEIVSMRELAMIAIQSRTPTTSKIIFNEQSDPAENDRIIFNSNLAKRDFGYEPATTLSSGFKLIHDFLDLNLDDYYKIEL